MNEFEPIHSTSKMDKTNIELRLEIFKTVLRMDDLMMKKEKEGLVCAKLAQLRNRTRSD